MDAIILPRERETDLAVDHCRGDFRIDDFNPGKYGSGFSHPDPLYLVEIWMEIGTGFVLERDDSAVIGHAAFWPGILQIWAKWIPARYSPFLDPWRLITDGIQGQTLIPDKAGFLVERATYIWLVIRLHFVSVIGVAASILLFPKKQEWQSKWKRQTAIFLVVLYPGSFCFSSLCNIRNGLLCFLHFALYILL